MSLEVQQSKMQSLNMEWNNLKQQCWLDTGWVKRDNKLNMSKWCVLAVKKANHNLGYITKVEGNDPPTLLSAWEIHIWSAVSSFCVPSTGKTWTYEWWVITIIQGWSIWCTRRGWGSWVFFSLEKKDWGRDLIAIFNSLMGLCRQDRPRLSPAVHGDRITAKGHKL